MTLPLLRLVAGAVDDEDRYRRLIEDRDAEADRYVCQECGRPDPSGQWECGDCWANADEEYEREQDR